jgi:sialate O-acetylesterase
MIHPLAPMSIAGIVWYQGEANVARGYQYRALLPALITDWRNLFSQGDIPFFVMMLPRWGEQTVAPGRSAIAELREAQVICASTVPSVHLINTIDLGDPKDVHPIHKRPFGERAALAIAAVVNGRTTAWRGPRFRRLTQTPEGLLVDFEPAGVTLVSSDGQPISGFAIAGDDQVFHLAQATIREGAVLLSSPDAPQPIAVRYGWSESPVCNLAGPDGVLASPFRSDDWPIPGQPVLDSQRK